MESIYLKQQIKNELQGNPLEDINSPFSFLEWKGRLPDVSESAANYLYNEYLIKWFRKNKDKPVDSKFQLRQKYIYLLNQLELFFTTEEKNNWYRQINFADEKELLLAIPYFARRLKDIALYYLKLRNRLKNTKLRYNANGTGSNIEQQIYEYLLDTFLVENTELTPQLYTTVPLFSSIQKRLTVQVEEKYDDQQYFDISITKPVSAYFNLTDIATEKFLATKGIVLSSAHWLFQSFNIPVSTTFDSVFSELTGNLFELTDIDTYNSFIQKYLGQSKSLLTFSNLTSSTEIYDIEITEGNNFFYYPYGTIDTKFTTSKQIPTIALSTIQFENFLGTDGASSPKAGTTLEDSDTIFVTTGDVTKGAWLKYQLYNDVSKTVKVGFKKDATTSFIFPFPGFGLSGNNFPWTGSTFESTTEYPFLATKYRAAVDEAYWSQELPSDSCDSILLNDTTLAFSGATPNLNPNHADQIFIRTNRDLNTSTPFKNLSGAWLYRFQKTSLPVSPTQENLFLWPYQALLADEEFPSFLEKLDYRQVCNSISIQELPTSYFIAASSFELADRIYKLAKYSDTDEEAIECAWLSGSLISNNQFSYIRQDGFSSLFSPTETVKFVWTGPPATLQEVFAFAEHRRDCPFVTNSPKTKALEWQKCTCKQVYHSPFGHPYDTFESGNYGADCIAKVVDPLMESLEFSSWRDSLGNSIATSPNSFAWYKNTGTQKWGYGQWVSNTDSAEPFKLETGKAYFYKRASNRFVTDENEEFPPYIVNYKFPNSVTKWVDARKNAEGDWENTNLHSVMKINPGDFIKVYRQPVTTSFITSAYDVQTIVSSNLNSVWASNDTIPVVCGEQNGTIISWPTITDPYDPRREQYPAVTFEQLSSIKGWTITREEDGYAETLYDVQFVTFVPPTTGTYSVSVTANVVVSLNTISLSTITATPATSSDLIQFALQKTKGNQIAITLLSGVESTYLNIGFTPNSSISAVNATPSTSADHINFALDVDYDKTIFVSTTPLTGKVSNVPTITSYDVSIIYDSFQYLQTGEETEISVLSSIVINTIIPKISALNPYTKETTLLEFTTPAGGFVLEHTLKGWNYNTNSADSRSRGARPYWATLDVEKTLTTRWKGVYSWGYPDSYVDGYIPNNTPPISPLEILYGTTIEYTRKGYSFSWVQPIVYKEYVNTTQWCQLSADTTKASNLSAFYATKQKVDPIVHASNVPTDITLSNIINGSPVEIYYNAINSFVWPISVVTTQTIETPSADPYFVAENPWETLQNRFNPTIANVPVQENVYSLEDVGGYFLPQNLGASFFVNKEFDVNLKTLELSGSFLIEDTSVYVGGRGRSGMDQPTLFDWKENNQWLKESITTGDLAGAIKHDLTKVMQTFIPYQSNTDQTALGLVTNETRVSPWGGYRDEEWTDIKNDPRSFTGVRNVSAWANSQVIKQTDKPIEEWASDIYGNQYGLYKILENVEVSDQKTVSGELWVKLNDQTVKPGYVSLSSVFDPFKYDQTVFAELTGTGILSFNCYFDTLFIETRSILIFAKIDYNYDAGTIECVFDDTRYKYKEPTFRFEKNWFFSDIKKIITLYTEFSGTGSPLSKRFSSKYKYYPTLYELDLDARKTSKIYPTTITETSNLTAGITEIDTGFLKDCSIYFNKSQNQFLITYTGSDTTNNLYVLDFTIDNVYPVSLSRLDYYTNLYDPSNMINDPPIVLPQYLNTISVNADQFVVSVSALNSPVHCDLLNYNTQITAITADGYVVFRGQLSPGLHHVNYTLINSAGDVTYSLTLSAL